MIRKIAMAMLLSVVVAVPASAQTRSLTSKNFNVTFMPVTSTPAKKVDFSRIAPVVAASKTAPAQSTAKKSFWKTPWPYVIIVGIAAVVVVAVNSGGAGGY